MIIFLHGENTYGSRQNLSDLVAKYQEKHRESVNFFEFNFDDNDDWDRLRSAIQTFPLFAENKLIVVKNIFASKKADDFRGLIKESNLVEDKSVFLIIWERLSAPKLKSASFLLKNNAVRQKEFVVPQGRKLDSWIRKEFERRGLTIAPDALNQLILFVNHDFMRLAAEIDKLAVFKKKGTVNIRDINELVIPEAEQNVFQLTDAILADDKNRALAVLEEFLNDTTDRSVVINLLAVVTAQFRNLIVIKDLLGRSVPAGMIAQKTGIHPFAIRKSMPALKRFEPARLKKIYNKLLSLDIALKSRNLNSLLLFDMFLFSV